MIMKRKSSCLFLIFLWRVHTSDSKLSLGSITKNKELQNEDIILKTTLFAEKCIGDDFEILVTPVGECYSGKDSNTVKGNIGTMIIAFNNPYGENDIKDELIEKNGEIVGIKRSFFLSTNSTCTGGVTDSFPNIPLNTCVGPFGEPRPWGILNLIKDDSIHPEVL